MAWRKSLRYKGASPVAPHVVYVVAIQEQEFGWVQTFGDPAFSVCGSDFTHHVWVAGRYSPWRSASHASVFVLETEALG